MYSNNKITFVIILGLTFFIGCTTKKNVTFQLINIENNTYGNLAMNCFFDNFIPIEMFENNHSNYNFNIQVPLGVLIIENHGNEFFSPEALYSDKWSLITKEQNNIAKYNLCTYGNITRYKGQIKVLPQTSTAIVVGKPEITPRNSFYQREFPAEMSIWVEYNDDKMVIKSNPVLGRRIERDNPCNDYTYPVY